MNKPLAIDLFCGLGGWTEGLLAEGYYVVGFDIEKHEYGDAKYPAQLVLQDVMTIHGKQFKDVALIVASPPCQEYSYMAMPWSRAKAIAAEYRSGVRDVKNLTALFDACFRIQREASEVAGHHIPMVVENVRGAIPWVGRSRWNFGNFHLWGDVPALMPMTKTVHHKIQSPHLFLRDPARAGGKYAPQNSVGVSKLDGSGKSFQTASVEGTKASGQDWNNFRKTGEVSPDWKFQGKKFTISAPGKTSAQTRDPVASTASGSKARKAASALIAKIPSPLSRHIAAVYKP